MQKFKMAWKYALNQFASWKGNARIWVVLFLSGMLFFQEVWKLTQYCMINGETLYPCYLVKVFSAPGSSNESIKLLTLMGGMLLFCDAPFYGRQKQYALMRGGCGSWWLGDVLFICCAVFLYVFWLWLFSICMSLPCISLTDGWGSGIRLVAKNSTFAREVLYSGFRSSIVNVSNPGTAVGYVFITAWGVMTMYGLLLECVFLWTGKAYIGILIVVFLILVDPVIMVFPYDIQEVMYHFSPTSWVSVERSSLSQGTDGVSVGHVFVSILIVCSICLMGIRYKIKRIDVQ